MVCFQALCKRLKGLHYDFLPDFIVNVNYFSISGFFFGSSGLSCLFCLCSVGFFYLTFRLRARGPLDDLFISLLKKSRKSVPLKTG